MLLPSLTAQLQQCSVCSRGQCAGAVRQEAIPGTGCLAALPAFPCALLQALSPSPQPQAPPSPPPQALPAQPPRPPSPPWRWVCAVNTSVWQARPALPCRAAVDPLALAHRQRMQGQTHLLTAPLVVPPFHVQAREASAAEVGLGAASCPLPCCWHCTAVQPEWLGCTGFIPVTQDHACCRWHRLAFVPQAASLASIRPSCDP